MWSLFLSSGAFRLLSLPFLLLPLLPLAAAPAATAAPPVYSSTLLTPDLSQHSVVT